jgi:hypothetical protein
VEANSTGGQGSRRAVAPSDDEITTLTPEVCTMNSKFLFYSVEKI